jgi:hypothetical protein
VEHRQNWTIAAVRTTSSTTIRRSSLGLNPLPYGNGNTWPGVYDSLGRNFFVNITAKF